MGENFNTSGMKAGFLRELEWSSDILASDVDHFVFDVDRKCQLSWKVMA
jgi:hypothetical protein